MPRLGEPLNVQKPAPQAPSVYRQFPRARRSLPAIAAKGSMLTLLVEIDQMAAPVPALMPKTVPLLFEVYTVLSAPAMGDGRSPTPVADPTNRPGVAQICAPETMDTPIMLPAEGL